METKIYIIYWHSILPKRQSPQFEFSFFLDRLYYLFVSDDTLYHIVKCVALKQKPASKVGGGVLCLLPYLGVLSS